MLSCLELILQVALLQQAASQTTPEWATGASVIPVFKPPFRPLEGIEPTTEKMADVKDFDKETIDSPLMGLLYAGKSEFNWIVDIRVEDLDQEHWSIGNLVTYFHVMTTCRAATTLVPTTNQMKVHTAVTIYYAQSYLFYEPTTDDDTRSSGKRSSNEILPHPKCQPDSLLNDFALLRLTQEVRPYTPLLGYMPVLLTDTPRDISALKDESNICYIAAYGKDYRNVKTVAFHIVKDFKIKFRVYYLDPKECEKHYDKICGSQRSVCNQASNSTNWDKLICVRPRKRVGALCDHHRGAPLVCQGIVRGVVIRGVDRNNCNNLLQFPVIVLRTDEYANELYEQIAVRKLSNDFDSARGGAGEEEETSLCALHHPNSFLVVAILISWILCPTYEQ
uniref:Granzyme C n=2 Tax=Lygus hesperus TaxID=30085 RepID=A0A0A9Z0K7_LYGHE